MGWMTSLTPNSKEFTLRRLLKKENHLSFQVELDCGIRKYYFFFGRANYLIHQGRQYVEIKFLKKES